MKKIYFILFITFLVSSDSLWACAESLMPNQEDDYALIDASSEGHIEVVRALLENEANINLQDSSGRTALIHASSEGHTEIVRALLAAGANVNHHDNDGWTALRIALFKGYIEIVRLLLEFGANVNYI